MENGDYSIKIDLDSLPDGYKITLKDADGSGDNNDSDINSDGNSDSVTIEDANTVHWMEVFIRR